MKGRLHLKKTADFAAVHKYGKWIGSRILGIKSRNNNLAYTRCGIITSKKVGKAVIRNQVKRRIRELVRSYRIKSGYDIIIISRTGIEKATFEEINETLRKLLDNQRLLDNSDEIYCTFDD